MYLPQVKCFQEINSSELFIGNVEMHFCCYADLI